MNEKTLKKLRRIGLAGVVMSLILGLQLEAVFYYVFGIHPQYVSPIAIVGLWLANAVIIACVIDELVKFRRMIYKLQKNS